MKKIAGLLASLLVVLSVTGCGNEVKCTGEMDGQKATVKATVDSDKVSKVVVEYVSEAETKEKAEQAAAMLNGLGAMDNEAGITISAKASGKKVTMTTTMDITKMESTVVEDTFGSQSPSKDDFINTMEEEGLTCK